jgi:hypothetical protein
MFLFLNNDDKQTLPMNDQIKQLMDQLLPVFNSGNPDESLEQIMANLSQNFDAEQTLKAVDQLKIIFSQFFGKEMDLYQLNPNQILNMIGECGTNMLKYKIECKKDPFEPYSVNTSMLYNCLIFDNPVTSKLINLGKVDVSGPLLYLGNIIEYELNASIGQAMRMILLDINMTRFHMEYCDEINEEEIRKQKKIDIKPMLNYYFKNPVNGKKRLATVPMGDLCVAYKKVLNDPRFNFEIIPEKLRIEEEIPESLRKYVKGKLVDRDYFTYYIQRFSDLRSQAAHPVEVDMDVFADAFKWYSFIVENYMPLFAELKRRLKAPPQE